MRGVKGNNRVRAHFDAKYGSSLNRSVTGFCSCRWPPAHPVFPMNNFAAIPSSSMPRARSRDGQRRFLAVLLGFIGLLHFLFSVLTLTLFIGEDRSLIEAGGLPLPFLSGGSPFAGLISGYVVFQIWSGLILGPVSLVAAYALIRSRYEGFVKFVAWINLVYAPTGTTVGILLLIALRRGMMRSPPIP